MVSLHAGMIVEKERAENMIQRIRNRRKAGVMLCIVAAMGTLATERMQVKGAGAVYAAYQEYETRFSQIQTIADIKAQGYQVVEKHIKRQLR